jgi:hydroxymethylbilane synthase
VFVKELEEALLDGRAHLAVHSAKDLPGELPDGLAVLAVPARADARDVLVGPPGGLGGLAPGATVATGSPRRAAQILAARPDLRIVPIRGNVGTRLDTLAAGVADALVLAAAGLHRLGLAPEGASALAVDVSTPAPGQGLLALEGRADDLAVAAAVAALDDPVAHACLIAERALLEALGGGCLQPVGAFCDAAGGGLRITAFAGSDDGARAARVVREGPLADPAALGRAAAAALASIRA